MEEGDAVKSSFLDIPHNTDNPAWQGGMRPNGPKLFSPAEADKATWVLRLGDGPGKLQSRPSPPGQHHRGVVRHVRLVCDDGVLPTPMRYAGEFPLRKIFKSAL